MSPLFTLRKANIGSAWPVAEIGSSLKPSHGQVKIVHIPDTHGISLPQAKKLNS